MAVDSVPVPLVATEFRETSPAVSPDGRWLAYASNESGRGEVHVRPFPNTNDGKWLVSTDGGREPVRNVGAEEAWELIVVENFFEELKAKVGNE